MINLRDKLQMLLNESGDYNEDVILMIINEKVKRYDELKEKIEYNQIRETAGVIDSITKLENSIVESIEKYLKLKYPYKYSIRLLKEENKDMISKDEYNEIKLLLEQSSISNNRK